MANPTIENYFGSTASIVDSISAPVLASGKKYLLVETDGLGLTEADREDPDKILAKLLVIAGTYSAGDTSNENGVELTAPTKQGFSTRNNQATVAWGVSGTIYTLDETAANLDVTKVI